MSLDYRQPYAPPPRHVEIRRSPETPAALDVPPIVSRHFAARSLVVSTGSRMSQMVAQLARIGRRLVEASELPAEVLAALKQHGYRVDPDGSVILGDSALYVQPRAQRDLKRAQMFREIEEREGGDEFREMVEQANRAGHGALRFTLRDDGLDSHRSFRASPSEVDAYSREAAEE